MGSRDTHVMGSPAVNFQLPVPLRSRLRVRNGTDRQTDGQTDNGHHHYSSALWGRRHNDGTRQRQSYKRRIIRHCTWCRWRSF